jgi:hypothetical protein
MKLQPKNHHTDGGDTWVVDGKLVFGEGAEVEGFPSGAESVSWDQVQGKPNYIAAGGTADEAREVIGAGTSNLILVDPGGTNGSSSQAARADHSHAAATTSAAGLMSAADKTKLNGIAASANNYTLPAASSGAIGGVRQGVAVPDAAADPVTKAEFDALLASLRTAGVIAAA